MPPLVQNTVRATPIHERLPRLLPPSGGGCMSARTPCGPASAGGPSAARASSRWAPGHAQEPDARRLKLAFHDARHFEYLMTRFQHAGGRCSAPPSRRSKEDGKYLAAHSPRVGLPEAEVVFLDEIWKAAPPSSTPCSPPSTSGSFRNGDSQHPIPMRLLVTASNELPAPDSGLEALYDRMLVGLDGQGAGEIQLPGHAGERWPVPPEPDPRCRSGEEYAAWQEQIEQVRLPDACFELIYQLRQQLDSQLSGTAAVSDRRWKKAVQAHQGERLLQRQR